MKKIIFVGQLFFATIAFCQEFNSKSAIIETPEMQVFYEGIPILLNVEAFGEYKDIQLNIPNPYTAPPGSAGSIVTVTCSAVNKKGKRVDLEGCRKFTVKKTPKPELSWGGFTDGSTVRAFSQTLSVGYGDNVPFGKGKDNFTVVGYVISVYGLKGTLEGEGSEISELHLEALKAISKGNKITIQVKYSGSSNGLITSMFEL
ncbi:MAG: hypothetical protein FJX84_05315 [Bacteroidetes bacterium]|nr:hypothetical protein [Bacteroidota bacterium]